jgi:hypothetical protein
LLLDRLALRIGPSADAQVKDMGMTTDFVDDPSEKRIDPTDWAHRYSAIAQLMCYGKGQPDRFFCGGPKLSYEERRHEDILYQYEENGLVEKHRDDRRHAWGFRGSGALGVQWCLTEGIALHAEYGLSVTFETEEAKIDYTYSSGNASDQTTTTEITGVEVSSEGVMFGVSVYF